MTIKICDKCGAINREDNPVREHDLWDDEGPVISGDYCKVCFNELVNREIED